MFPNEIHCTDAELGHIALRVNARARRFTFRVREGALVVTCPPHSSVRDVLRAVEQLRPRLSRMLQRSEPSCHYSDAQLRELTLRARQQLLPRLAELAQTHGFRYLRASVRPSRTRWGSCSMRGTISLSVFLVLLPPHLQDYVMLHELCHTREMNHAPRFHFLLDTLLQGREAQLRRELRQHRALLPQ